MKDAKPFMENLCAVITKDGEVRVDLFTPHEMWDDMYDFLRFEVKAWIYFPKPFYAYMPDRGEWRVVTYLEDNKYYFVTYNDMFVSLVKYVAEENVLVDVLNEEKIPLDVVDAYMTIEPYDERN